ncbi:MAG TPA: MarR family winged helix-turn-helix transcriptional regulator [Steroidobacteraceae bacterium]|nr:MarR family winged helix-turn-helix transcriptional regulator [Steroidobacteraceae bacterium]
MAAERAAEPSLAYLLSDVVRLMKRDFHVRATGLGLTPALARLLFHVHRVPGSHQTALAHRLDVTPVTLCRMVDRLARRGYVRRQPDPRDRRAVRVYVAARGEPLVARMAEVAEQTSARALQGIAARERAALLRLLGRLAGNLSAEA